MNNPENCGRNRSEHLIEQIFNSAFGEMTAQEKATFEWANHIL